jgi:hypothetical protein
MRLSMILRKGVPAPNHDNPYVGNGSLQAAVADLIEHAGRDIFAIAAPDNQFCS